MGKEKNKQKKVLPYEIGELDQYLFGQGTHYEIYQKMGAHKAVGDEGEGVYFAVWAPHARRVAVIGRSRLGFIHVLCRKPEKEICINFVLKQNKGSVSLKRILLQITQNCVRGRLQGLRISAI